MGIVKKYLVKAGVMFVELVESLPFLALRLLGITIFCFALVLLGAFIGWKAVAIGLLILLLVSIISRSAQEPS